MLNANGVLFAGIMGFIYSDLIVPPLVAVNAKYYGWRVASYIAGVMYVSMVSTALVLHAGFATLDITPESERVVEEVTRFALDYTFLLNVLMAGLALWLIRLHRQALRREEVDGGMEMEGGGPVKRGVALLAAVVILAGAAAWLVTSSG